MAFDTAFLDLMADTVTYKPAASTDAYGEETFGDPVTIQCRVVTKRRFIRTVQGDEREVNTEITTGGFFDVSDNGMIVIDGSEHKIQAVETFTDEEGPHHQKVLL